MQVNTTASYNVAVGAFSLDANTTGTENTAVGYNALTAVTTGDQNVGIGIGAGQTITTGTGNIMIGRLTDGGVSGDNNIGIGVAHSHADTGNNNVIIGYACAPSSSSVSNEGILATNNHTGKGASTFFISPANGNVFQGNNSANWATSSDQRIKKNIVDSTIGLTEINQLKIRNFEYRTEDEITDFDNPKSAVVDKSGVQVGVIAQEIQTVLPKTVKEESTGVLTVDPDNLTWHLVKAIQELSAKNDALEARIKTLEGA